MVVGDGASGKTSLLHVFVNGSFPQVCSFSFLFSRERIQ